MLPVLVFALALFAPAGDDLLSGARAMEARDYATAVRHFQTALRRDPANPQILSSLGVCLAGMGRFAEAAQQFRAAAKREPTMVAHQYNLGLALLNANDYEGGEKAFRTVLRLHPKHGRGKAQLAHSILGQARGGVTSKMQAAAAAYAEALPDNPADPELRFNYAFTLARTGDEEGALREYAEAVRLAPGVPQARFSLGITLFQLGRWQEALASFEAASARGLDDFELHYYLGSALLKTGNLAAAQKHLEMAATRNSSHPGAHFQLSSLYRAQGDKTRAIAEQQLFRELSAKQEADWRRQALEGAAQRALRQGDLAQGISALLQAFASRPDATVARNLALAYLKKGDTGEARKYLEKARELAPEDAVVQNYLGLLSAREGDLAAAAGHFEKAVALDPGMADAYYNAGVAAAELKRYDTAIARFRTALGRSQDPRIREALAMVLADAGRHTESQREFEAAQKQRAAGGTP